MARVVRGCIAVALLVAALNAPALAEQANQPAGMPTLTVSKAIVSKGRLVIEGKSSAKGKSVSIVGTSYKAKVSSKGNYAFSLTSLPPTCKVSLQVGAKRLKAVIADCGPRGEPGLVARGAWRATASYEANDIVTRAGSSYRAIKPSKNANPSTTSGFWAVLAAKGADGAAGPQGAVGATGPAGPAGPAGATGPAGANAFVDYAYIYGYGGNGPLTAGKYTLLALANQKTFTVTSGQKIFVTATTVGKRTAGSDKGLGLSICSQLMNGPSTVGDPTGDGNYIYVPTVTATDPPQTFSAARVLTSLTGTYRFGLCVKPAVAAMTIDFNFVQGFVQVMN